MQRLKGEQQKLPHDTLPKLIGCFIPSDDLMMKTTMLECGFMPVKESLSTLLTKEKNRLFLYQLLQ